MLGGRHALLGWTLALAGALGGATGSTRADRLGVGTWKVMILNQGQEVTLWLVKIEEQGGQPRATIAAPGVPDLKDAKVEALKVDRTAVRLSARAKDNLFEFAAYFPPKEEAALKLLGSVSVRGQRLFAQLERTDRKELKQNEVAVPSPNRAELVAAMQTTDAKERVSKLREFVDHHAGDPLIAFAGSQVLGALVQQKAAEADVRTYAEKLLNLGAAYGPEMKLQVATQVAQLLTASDSTADLALGYARQAEKLLESDKDASLAQQESTLKALHAALRKSNKMDAAKVVADRLKKVDVLLDEEFEKTAIPFKPERLPARPSKGDRVVVLELFTGAQCPPCVSADVAFDALIQAYASGDVVLLQYHLHIPRPDPLTNGDGEQRAAFYGVRGTPTVFINGKPGPQVGGFREHSKDRYDTLLKELGDHLEKKPDARIELSAVQTGDELAITTAVTGVMRKEGLVHLRYVLIEEVVRYPGSNGQRLHHHVVRAMPGGADGMAIKDGKFSHTAKVTLSELRKSLNAYLDSPAAKRKFMDDERPLDLKNLKIVALVQEDASKEILQAAQVNIRPTK
jgi:hypothetical protein